MSSYFDQSTHVLTVSMSRYDIADYLGTSAETVTRAFTRLEREGLLRRVTARTVELEPELLKAFISAPGEAGAFQPVKVRRG